MKELLDQKGGVLFEAFDKKPLLEENVIVSTGINAKPGLFERGLKIQEKSIPISYYFSKNLIVFPKYYTLISEEQGLIKESEYMLSDNQWLFHTNNYQGMTLLESKPSILIGNASWQGYYHWLIQCVTSLVAFEKLGVNISRCQVYGPPLNNWMRDILEIVGVNNYHELETNKVSVLSDVYFNNVLWSSFAFSQNGFLLEWFRNKIGIDSDNKGTRKIYISRADTNRRSLTNEGEVIQHLKAQNFEILVCSELSVQEQMKIFSEAELVVAPHGGALSNIVFCNNNVTIVELFQENYLNRCFKAIAEALNLSYYALVNQCIDKQLSHHESTFSVNLDELDNLLKKHF